MYEYNSPLLSNQNQPQFFSRSTSQKLIEREPRRFPTRDAAVVFRQRHEGKFKISAAAVRRCVLDESKHEAQRTSTVHQSVQFSPYTPRLPRSIVEERGIRKASSHEDEGEAHFEYTHDPRLATDAGMFSGFPPDARNRELASLIETPSLFVRYAAWKERCTFPYLAAWGSKGGGEIRIADLPGGHFEFVESPAATAAAVVAFLGGDDSVGAAVAADDVAHGAAGPGAGAPPGQARL